MAYKCWCVREPVDCWGQTFLDYVIKTLYIYMTVTNEIIIVKVHKLDTYGIESSFQIKYS